MNPTLQQKQAAYLAFLRTKIPHAELTGIEPPCPHHASLKPHQVDICQWALRGGRRAVFAQFGLGKTRMHLQIAQWVVINSHRENGYKYGECPPLKCKYLIIAPLGVRQEFTSNDGPAMGLRVEYVRTMAEAESSMASILITNYERVRDGDLDPKSFAGAGLDESAVLRSFGSLTYQSFLTKFANIRFRFLFTATPSPNRYKELIHYGAFLGIMDSGQALTRFFKRDSSEAGNLQLMSHMECQFWYWLRSWAAFLQSPSDLGYDSTGYDLPKMHIHWHRLEVDHTANWTPDAGTDSWGQRQLFIEEAQGLSKSAAVKRNSVSLRISSAMSIIGALSINQKDDPKRTESKVLSSKQRAGKRTLPGELPAEQTQNRPRCAEGLHGGVSQDLPEAQTDGGRHSREEQAKEGEICSGPGIQSERNCGGETLSRTKSGNAPEKPRPQVRNCARGLQVDADTAKQRMCDLPERENQLSEEGSTPFGRPRSRDGKSSRTPVRQLQQRPRPLPGQSQPAHECHQLSDQVVIWCDLNAEQEAMASALSRARISASSLTGSQKIDERERLIDEWRAKRTSAFLSKPMMYGAGVNLQQCHTMVFVGIGYKFADFIQAIHRVYRFQQEHEVHIHIIYLDTEDLICEELKAKWRRHNDLVDRMTGLLKKHKLAPDDADILARTIGVEREERRAA